MNKNRTIQDMIANQNLVLEHLKKDIKDKKTIKNPYYYEGYKIGYIEGIIEGLKQAESILKEGA